MASPSSLSTTHTPTLPVLLFIISSLQLSSVSSFEYQVRDRSGWVVPRPSETNFYNDWASEKRFKVGDTIRFKYRKDSVMEVSERDYSKCTSRRPNFFSNTGNTVFTLDRSGSFYYFISGASGHCDKGQRLVVNVMSHDDHNSSPASSSSSASPSVALCHHHHLLFTILTFHFLLPFLHLASRLF